jgi:type I restriction enzyme M protein
VPAEQILQKNCNLDIKNPRGRPDLEHLPPQQLVESILEKERQIVALLSEIQTTLKPESMP